jgi:hypothetical protein
MSVVQKWNHQTGTIKNLTPFGRDLVRLARARLGLLAPRDFAWSDGGCLMFAEGLTKWSLGAMRVAAISATIKDGPVEADHAVARWTCKASGISLYLDSDGLVSGPELVSRWCEMEGRLTARIIDWPQRECLIESDAGVSMRVAEALLRQFGPFDPYLLFDSALYLLNSSPASVEAADMPAPAF